MNHPQNSISLWKDVPNLKWLAVWPAGNTLKKNIGFYAVGMHAQVATFADGGLEKSSVAREFSAKSCHGWWMIRISKDFLFSRMRSGHEILLFATFEHGSKKNWPSKLGWFPTRWQSHFFVNWYSSLRYQVEISWRKMVSNNFSWISSNQVGAGD